MVEPAVLHKPATFVIPRDILPAHVEGVFLHEGDLGGHLVRQELVVIVEEREVLARRLAAGVVARRPAAGLAGGVQQPKVRKARGIGGDRRVGLGAFRPLRPIVAHYNQFDVLRAVVLRGD